MAPSVQLERTTLEGAKVRFNIARGVENCSEIGTVITTMPERRPPFQSSWSELSSRARNEAAGLGANTLVPLDDNSVTEFKHTYTAYDCPESEVQRSSWQAIKYRDWLGTLPPGKYFAVVAKSMNSPTKLNVASIGNVYPWEQIEARKKYGPDVELVSNAPALVEIEFGLDEVTQEFSKFPSDSIKVIGHRGFVWSRPLGGRPRVPTFHSQSLLVLREWDGEYFLVKIEAINEDRFGNLRFPKVD